MTKQIHHYISTKNHTLFVSEYQSLHPNGITIVAQPIGPEYMHCKAAVRQLALRLSESGQTVYVFDWPGYGNSCGELPKCSTVAIQQEAFLAVVNYAQQQCVSPSIVMLRSTALLANAIIENYRLNSIVYWYPYTQGKALVRDLQLIDDSLSISTVDSSHIEAGGYPILASELSNYDELSLNNLKSGSCQQCLVLHTPETKRLRFLGAIEPKSNQVETIKSPNLHLMARQAELSTVPETDISSIASFVSRNTDTLVTPLKSRKQEFTVGEGLETPITFGAKNYFGILSQPKNVDRSKCLIIPNTGSGHHSGPNGLHTLLARALLPKGYSCFRFDIGHLGNSGTDSKQNNNFAYSTNNAVDLEEAVNQLKEKGYSNFSLLGICSGAFSIYSMLLSTKKNAFSNVFLVNPNTLYWKTGDNPQTPELVSELSEEHYHSQQALNIRAWLNLVASPSKWIRVFKGALSILLRKTTALLKRNKKTVFDQDCERICSKVKKLHFIFTPNDTGLATIGSLKGSGFKNLIHKKKVIWDILESGDHTFTKLDDRKILAQRVSEDLPH